MFKIDVKKITWWLVKRAFIILVVSTIPIFLFMRLAIH